MIIYFSSTGNTAQAALMLAGRLGDSHILSLEGDTLLHPESVVIKSVSGKVIWAFPTYSWGIPPVVLNFIRNVRLSRQAVAARHYMLTTCGDDMAYTDRQWRREMKRRNLNAVAAYAVEMPNTYVCMKGFDVDPKLLEKSKLAAAPHAVERIAESIMAGEGRDMLVRKQFSWIKTYIIYPWFCRFEMSPKPFHATDTCISCGKCAASCPMQNIHMADGRPHWSDHCALCLRCYHICPTHSVEYGNHTHSKGQYLNPNLKHLTTND